MKTTNHTPGPWNLNGSGILLHPVTNAQLVTQRIETYLGSFEILDETNEPDANAHLIASAPDLLEALRFLLADYIAIQGDQLTGSSVPIEMAQAAISKAEGLK